MRKKPYLIDGIIGNSKMLASLTKDGQLQRLFWPHIDFSQHMNRFYTGINLHDGNETQFIHEDGWEHEQSYQGETNILTTYAVHKERQVAISQTDYIVPAQDIFVRDYKIKNNSESSQNVSLVIFSDFTVDDRSRFNTVLFNFEEDCLVHYHREYAFAVGSSQEAEQYQCGLALEAARENKLSGKVVMNKTDGAISWNLGMLQPGQEVHMPIFITAGHTMEEALSEINKAKDLGTAELYRLTEEYWDDYLKQAKQFDIKDPQTRNVYIRSLLAFKLLNDEEKGGFIAGPEVDEDYDYSGGYAYCWGRDAAYIASAVDQAGYHDTVSKFYNSTMEIQSEDGSWQQRHYIDGLLAPTWGLQIDESGSILWGIHQHYLESGDEQFLQDIWPAVEKGAEFLNGFIDAETNLPLPSKDLWEKRDGEHLYSAAAVYGGLMGSAEIARKFERADLAAKWEQTASLIRDTVEEKCWNEETDSYLRGLKLAVDKEKWSEAEAEGKLTLTEHNQKGYPIYRLWEDPVVDVSLLGLNVPFNMLPEDDEKMNKTAATIERLLTSPIVGGIERFPGDVYIGGNPWILTTLWLAQYYVRIGKYEKARKYLNWSVDQANHLGLLPEQVDKKTGEPAWVMPLTWSHAMYVLTVIALEKKGELNK